MKYQPPLDDYPQNPAINPSGAGTDTGGTGNHAFRITGVLARSPSRLGGREGALTPWTSAQFIAGPSHRDKHQSALTFSPLSILSLKLYTMLTLCLRPHCGNIKSPHPRYLSCLDIERWSQGKNSAAPTGDGQLPLLACQFGLLLSSTFLSSQSLCNSYLFLDMTDMVLPVLLPSFRHS